MGEQGFRQINGFILSNGNSGRNFSQMVVNENFTQILSQVASMFTLMSSNCLNALNHSQNDIYIEPLDPNAKFCRVVTK